MPISSAGPAGLGSLDPNVFPLDAFELQGTEGDTTRKMALKAPWVFSGETVQIGTQSLNDYIQDQINSSIPAALPIGSVLAWPSSSIPTGWLLCNGQAHGSTALQTVLESANVPDYREVALVGVGTRASGVATHDVFTLGQFKDDQIQNITGTFGSVRSNFDASVMSGAFSVGPALNSKHSTDLSNTTGRASFDASLVARAGTVTRGKQIGVNWIIKAA